MKDENLNNKSSEREVGLIVFVIQIITIFISFCGKIIKDFIQIIHAIKNQDDGIARKNYKLGLSAYKNGNISIAKFRLKLSLLFFTSDKTALLLAKIYCEEYCWKKCRYYLKMCNNLPEAEEIRVKIKSLD